MCFVLWVTEAADTYSEYLMLIAFPVIKIQIVWNVTPGVTDVSEVLGAPLLNL
jgi:hypothetical protein